MVVVLIKQRCVADLCHFIIQFKDIGLDHCISLRFGYVQVWTIQTILERE